MTYASWGFDTIYARAVSKRSGPLQLYREHFFLAEFVLATLLAVGVVVAAECIWGREAITSSLEGNRQPLYATTAQIAGSLVGFVIATVAIVINLSNVPRLRLLRETDPFKQIPRVFFEAARFLSVLTVWCLAALVLDRDSEPHAWVAYIGLWLAIICTARVYRCIYFLEKMINIAISKSGERSSPDRDHEL